VPCFNQARFLADALASAIAQLSPVSILVVDDGSTDNTRDVCARFAGVKYFYQSNRGLAAARNSGLHQANSEFVVFLDADDRLLPAAVDVGINRLKANPAAAFTSGEHRYIDAGGSVLEEWQRALPTREHYRALLRGNYVGMGATVMFRRTILAGIGGFDERLKACEDYDVYLRIASSHHVDAHNALVAEYRRHGANMSNDPVLMLKTALTVLNRQRAHAREMHLEQDLIRGLRYWETYYGTEMSHRIANRATGSRIAALQTLTWLCWRYPASAVRLMRVLAVSQRPQG
jgi:glycosyltransferase involved in cell wall biosynthesis